MYRFNLIATIPTKEVRSLVWEKDALVDWAAGGVCYELDRTIRKASFFIPYRFDAAIVSPTDTYCVVYDRFGTKGLVLENGGILREINRSYYCAQSYEFPIAFAWLADGREVLIHCPEEYNRLEIEVAVTGERLTASTIRKPSDFFHSRLAVSPSNTILLSAGWVWHPLDFLHLHRIEDAVNDPSTLDNDAISPRFEVDISSAAFLDDEHVFLATGKEVLDDVDHPNALKPDRLVLWTITNRSIVSSISVTEPLGTMMPINERFVVGFFENPKLIDTTSGQVVERLTHIDSGKQTSSIIPHSTRLPVMAIDIAHRRFAIATPDTIEVYAVEPTS